MASEKDPKQSSPDLLSSAKLAAGDAKSTISNVSGTVAGAAADLLGSAQDYGKLDKEKGVGQYVEKAENYLHQYGTSNQSAPTKPEAKPESHATGGDGKDSGIAAGAGDYLKKAQGFLGK